MSTRPSSTAVGFPGDHDLAGRVEVGDPHVGVGEVAGDLDLVVVEAEHRSHRADAGREPASCIAAARSVTSTTPSSNPSAPVAASAVYSPRLCPAQTFASMPSRSTASSTIRLETNVVSCALRVSLSSSASASSSSAPTSRLGDLAGLVDEFPAVVVDPGPAHPRSLRPLSGERECEHRARLDASGDAPRATCG